MPKINQRVIGFCMRLDNMKENHIRKLLNHVNYNASTYLPINENEIYKCQQELSLRMRTLLTMYPDLEREFASLPDFAIQNHKKWGGKRETGHMFRCLTYDDYSLSHFAMSVLQGFLMDTLSSQVKNVLFVGQEADAEMAWTIGPFLLDKMRFNEVLEWIETGEYSYKNENLKNIHLVGLYEIGVIKAFVIPNPVPYARPVNIKTHPNYIAAKEIGHYLATQLPPRLRQ